MQAPYFLLLNLSRRKEKYEENYEKKNTKKECNSGRSNLLFDYEDVHFVVQDLIDKVVESHGKSETLFPLPSQTSGPSISVADDLHNTECTSEPQYFIGLMERADLHASSMVVSNISHNLDTEEEMNVSELHENESSLMTESSFIRDSGIGASTIKTEELSTSSPEELRNTLGDNLSSQNSKDSALSQTKNNTIVDELCSEEDYIKQLVKRRIFCSSPKPDIKQEFFVCEKSLLQDEKQSTSVSKSDDYSQSLENNKNFSVCKEPAVKEVVEVQTNITSCTSPSIGSQTSFQPTDNASISSRYSNGLVSPVSDTLNDVVNSPNKHNSSKCIGKEKHASMKVTCPICNKTMEAKNINKHLDICTGVAMKKEILRKRSPLASPRQTRKLKIAPKIAKASSDVTVQQSSKSKGTDGLQHTSTPSTKLNESCNSSEDDDAGGSSLPSGMQSLKSALKETIVNNQAFSELVIQAATAVSAKEGANERAKPETTGQEKKQEKLVNCPLKERDEIRKKISPKFKVQFRTLPSKHTKNNLSESDEEDMEIEIPSVPTRRSYRRSASKKSYCEISSASEDEVQQKAKKRSSSSQKKRPKKCSSDEEEYRASEKDCKNEPDDAADKKDDKVEKESEKNDEDDSEEGEIGPSDINVEELLSRKFYKPDVKSLTSSMEVRDGTRYYNGMAIDPAQPRYLTGGVLRDYQITGFQWLKILFENGESGILADEMGLGKTIQSIAIICKLVQSGVKGPFLVCAPTSTLNNWFSEMQRFAPKIPLLLYHGTAPERLHLLQCFSEQVRNQQPLVVITSYDILMRDKNAFSSCCWSYLILDEGHRVKNLKGKTFQELKSLSATAKLMLTGTPLQNNLSELWSLLNFLLPEVFDDIRAFESWFDVDCIETNKKILSILHQILTPFLLRRVKADVEVKIPRKREVLIMAPLAALQDKYYRATVDRSIVQLVSNKEYYSVTPGVANPDILASNSQEKSDRSTRKLSRSKQTVYLKEKYNVDLDDFAINVTLSNMMMQLRKCCNHPYLLQYPLIRGSDDFRVDEDIVLTCGKMMLLDRMLPELKKQGHKVLLFSQMTLMLDILEDYCKLREYRFVRLDGSTKCDERFKYIKEFNENADIFIFLLSTRAGGLGINLTGADTVIIYDSDWNPQNDLQAQDRCHRIGQKKPVLVYRLVTMGTIDQQIVERAAMKRKLEKMIIHQKKFKGNLETELSNCKVVTPEELLTLLESNEHVNVVESKERAISESDLLRLLDRSDLCSDADSPAEKVDWFVTSPNSDSALGRRISTAPFQIIDETEKSKELIL